MNSKSKENVKKNMATGVGTAAGAAAGVGIGSAINPEEAQAGEVVTPEPESQQATTNQTAHQSSQQPAPQPEPQPEPKPEPEPHSEDEVEVVAYDRVTNQDGSQMDVAVVNVNGNEVNVLDVNVDGEADLLACDANQNGNFEDNEVEVVQGQGIAMQPLADAAGFDPMYADNDMPDYVNDADVDTYMA